MKISAIALATLALAPLSSVFAQATLPVPAPGPTDLALNKKYISSDQNMSNWDGGLTDGSWLPERTRTYATGNTATFPKTVTVDLEAPYSVGHVAIGVPEFGSTKTVKVSFSTDNVTFTEIGSYAFSLRKAENHLFSFAPTTARYVRLTYADNYSEQVNYPVNHGFTTELAVYPAGPAPVLPPIYPPLPPQFADVAAPKLDRDGTINATFLKKHNSFLDRIKQGPINLLFIGDSITEGWRNQSVRDTWAAHYDKYQPANFGISGDRTQHVLWRFDNGELTGINPNPKVAVLMIGTNNMGSPAEEIIAGDKKIVSEIHRRLPNTKLLLLGIFPRGASATDPVRAKIKGINAELAKLDDGNTTRYLDIGDKFLDANGNLPKEIMPDALHPSAAGYVIWADAMQPLLDQMMQ